MTDHTNLAMGAVLRLMRERHRLTLAAIGQRIYVTRQYLSMIELGVKPAPNFVIDAYLSIGRDSDMNRRTVISLLAAAPTLAGAITDPAGARLVLNYGLVLGERGRLAEARVWYDAATAVADWTGHNPTRGYVRARLATRRLYEGASVRDTVAGVEQALAISREPQVLVEAHAAMLQVHTRAGDLRAATAATDAMGDAVATAAEARRHAAFDNYVVCMIGPPRQAGRILDRHVGTLAADPVLDAEAQVYQGMAMVRDGDRAGVTRALQAVTGLGGEHRLIGVGVSDLLAHVRFDSPEVAALRAYARPIAG